MKKVMIEIKPIGIDYFSRELFITKQGSYVVKVDDNFYSKAPNEPEGEPCSKLKKDCLKIIT